MEVWNPVWLTTTLANFIRPFLIPYSWPTRYYHSLWCLIVSIRQGSDYTQADPNCLVLRAPADSAGLTDFTHFSKYYEN